MLIITFRLRLNEEDAPQLRKKKKVYSTLTAPDNSYIK